MFDSKVLKVKVRSGRVLCSWNHISARNVGVHICKHFAYLNPFCSHCVQILCSYYIYFLLLLLIYHCFYYPSFSKHVIHRIFPKFEEIGTKSVRKNCVKIEVTDMFYLKIWRFASIWKHWFHTATKTMQNILKTLQRSWGTRGHGCLASLPECILSSVPECLLTE